MADRSIAGSSSAAAAAAAVAVLHSSTATWMDYAPDMKQRQACLWSKALNIKKQQEHRQSAVGQCTMEELEV